MERNRGFNPLTSELKTMTWEGLHPIPPQALDFIAHYPSPFDLTPQQREGVLERYWSDAQEHFCWDFRKEPPPLIFNNANETWKNYPRDWTWRAYVLKVARDGRCEGRNCTSGDRLEAHHCFISAREWREARDAEIYEVLYRYELALPEGPHSFRNLMCLCNKCHGKDESLMRLGY